MSGLLTVWDLNNWFGVIHKPIWNPPDELFGPVWTVLYFLMGISFWLIWKSYVPEQTKRSAEIIFMIQLFFNFCWSVLFFRFHSPLWAFVDILLLILTISITTIRFSRISKLAAVFLLPYLGWVVFAAGLNYTIWIMNK
jgi:tryptophan-rich sensory protein